MGDAHEHHLRDKWGEGKIIKKCNKQVMLVVITVIIPMVRVWVASKGQTVPSQRCTVISTLPALGLLFLSPWLHRHAHALSSNQHLEGTEQGGGGGLETQLEVESVFLCWRVFLFGRDPEFAVGSKAGPSAHLRITCTGTEG